MAARLPDGVVRERWDASARYVRGFFCTICAAPAVYRFTRWQADRRIRMGMCDQHTHLAEATMTAEMRWYLDKVA